MAGQGSWSLKQGVAGAYARDTCGWDMALKVVCTVTAEVLKIHTNRPTEATSNSYIETKHRLFSELGEKVSLAWEILHSGHFKKLQLECYAHYRQA